MYVPTELLLEILQHLEKIDLKTVRLVSRSFSRYASGFLFDTVHISAHKVDFDILSNIADHPQLSRCVKKLKYDASQFPTMSKQCYMYELGLQLRQTMDPTGQPAHDNPNPDVNGFVETLGNRSGGWSHEANRQEAWRRYSHSSFIQGGYKKFLQHADRLEEVKNRSDYWRGVSKKLGHFSNIECAEMYTLWFLSDPIFMTLNASSCGSISRIGSPLSRSWNPIHLFPKYFSYGARWDSPPISSDGTAEFRTLNRLLQSLPRRVKNLRTYGAYIPVTAFIAGADVLAGLLASGFKEYDQLRSLSLGISDGQFQRDGTPIGIPSLAKLLRATTQLRNLRLNLPGKVDTHGLFYTIQDIFYGRHTMMWPYLQSLDINNLSTNAVEWIAFLAFSMPNLRSLTIFNIELGDDGWHVVVECMHRCLNLCNFRIRLGGPGLRYAGHTMVGDQNTPRLTMDEWGTEEHHIFPFKIAHYVLHGGRNPFLRTHQPDDALVEASAKLYASARRLQSRTMNNGSGLRSELAVNI